MAPSDRDRIRKTVHIVLNSHIDPVWLWPWQSGLDAALNTCRSVCDLLERHPDVIFTSGEAWKYLQVQRIDPALFTRIGDLVRKGQWEIIGGWWIQPDCNQPSGWGLERQIALGRQYFQEAFGSFPRIGYNVDSFGHAATLPRIMRAAGQNAYIMMRPQKHEMPLPARLFRWRGYAGDGPDREVVTFRLAGYAAHANEGEIHQAWSDLPEGVTHTMCLMGLGDHGGGPNEKLVQWVREHAEAIDGVRLVFSSPSRFFAAIAPQIAQLPLVTGELQMHAVGCYSVYRPVKVLVRRAEHLLRQAEVMLDRFPAAVHADREERRAQLTEAWRQVCFHHFHDTLGGTCIPSAYAQVEAQLGRALALADDVLQVGLRRACVPLPKDPRNRLVVCNAADTPFSGYVSFDVSIWPDFMAWPKAYRLCEGATQIPYQISEPEAAVPPWQMVRLIWKMDLAPGELRPIYVDRQPPSPPAAPAEPLEVAGDRIGYAPGLQVCLGDMPGITVGGQTLPLPRLDLIPDVSDTWSHDCDRYPEGPSAAATWNQPVLVDRGPLFATLVQRGQIGQSPLHAQWRIFAREPFAELILRVHWVEEFKVLKLTLPLPSPAVRRWDGIPAGVLERGLDQVERPIRDLMLLELENGQKLGVVCPEIYAADADAHRLRLTLLRSPLMAHHSQAPAAAPRARFSDRGEHLFRFRFRAAPDLTTEQLETHAWMMMRPPLVAEWTNGMPW
jgi:alpha-mannosidase